MQLILKYGCSQNRFQKRITLDGHAVSVGVNQCLGLLAFGEQCSERIKTPIVSENIVCQKFQDFWLNFQQKSYLKYVTFHFELLQMSQNLH